jgi:hypothetical protein
MQVIVAAWGKKIVALPLSLALAVLPRYGSLQAFRARKCEVFLQSRLDKSLEARHFDLIRYSPACV